MRRSNGKGIFTLCAPIEATTEDSYDTYLQDVDWSRLTAFIWTIVGVTRRIRQWRQLMAMRMTAPYWIVYTKTTCVCAKAVQTPNQRFKTCAPLSPAIHTVFKKIEIDDNKLMILNQTSSLASLRCHMHDAITRTFFSWKLWRVFATIAWNVAVYLVASVHSHVGQIMPYQYQTAFLQRPKSWNFLNA